MWCSYMHVCYYIYLVILFPIQSNISDLWIILDHLVAMTYTHLHDSFANIGLLSPVS